MSGDNGDRDDGPDSYSDTDTHFKRVWKIEWKNKLGKSTSDEMSSYDEALRIFNEMSKEKKNMILYECHKSIPDGKMLKMVPVLNSSKNFQKKNDYIHEGKPQTNTTGKSIFTGKLSRLLVLVTIVVALVITILLINFLSGTGSNSSPSHHFIVETTLMQSGINPKDLLS
ncbi:MAG: hypothetical protein M3162_05995 [Thermoproteota archaeon]|nr:hypothetical protein [Thermoproteota archaeon]